MRVRQSVVTSSPTDLANFLACRHKTLVDLLAVRGRIQRPDWNDPLAVVLRDRGLEHERRYVDALRAAGLRVVDLTRDDNARWSDEDAAAETMNAMRSGADVIVQAPIVGDGWFGYADVLRRVDGLSACGDWHYEVHDTKLSRETRGGTILQLCVYTDVLSRLQSREPEYFRVVTPAGIEAYRLDDFGAFYRLVVREYRAFLEARSLDDTDAAVYPEPTDHCDVCRWWERCNAARRKDDHLSFVAGLGRVQQDELETRDIPTLAALAGIPVPLAFKPKRGAKATYERLREQARLQKAQRESGDPTFELLSADDDQFGLRLLPEPSPGDLFLDFEGDPFARQGGREYLVGLGHVGADGAFAYESRWALTDADERAAFEWLMDEMVGAIQRDPGAHIYHFAPYEPAAVKRLMARYAAREIDVDELLRGRRFVDLFGVVRQSLRAGVESYSLKKLEPFYEFVRDVELPHAGDHRRLVEVGLETGDLTAITPAVRAVVEGYNRDDCRSTLVLRGWLESLRADLVGRSVDVPRPVSEEFEATEKVKERQLRIEALRPQLVAMNRPETTLLAYLLDWHYREDKVTWWEYFRLAALSDEDLFDEPAAVAGLQLVETVGPLQRSIVQRYRFPPQEFEIRPPAKLKLRDEGTFGELVAIDRDAFTIDVKRSKAVADEHPTSAFAFDHFKIDVLADSLFRLGEHVAARGFDRTANGAALGLLLREPPSVGGVPLVETMRDGEPATDFAVRIVSALDCTVLPIQGPPGAGKTYAGGRMICELVRQGKRVGVTATNHKVIRHLLKAAAKEAGKSGTEIQLGHKCDDESGDGVETFDDNRKALAALHGGEIRVMGGTAWMWARPEFAGAVDVLFVDEAGQMSLANALAVSQAANSLVLLGDPQQLEQPQKGSHPEGVGVSSLEHTLGAHQTMPREQGIFLPETWRLAPAICRFTSEVFYEGRLTSRPGLERQRLNGSARFDGAGLRIVEVSHEGNRNASDEEADVVGAIVDELVAPGVTWIDADGIERQLEPTDILVVAPYNAHVGRLHTKLDPKGIAVGTVDKFQGQEAPVVIYSMATSRPEDAPRGMSFLYNLNRLNVATSRAKCVCILVASPRLFEPDCRTRLEMRLANGVCRYRELCG